MTFSQGLTKTAFQLQMPTQKPGLAPKPPAQPAPKKFEPPRPRVTTTRRPGNPVPGLKALTGAAEMTSYGKPTVRKMLQRIRRH